MSPMTCRLCEQRLSTLRIEISFTKRDPFPSSCSLACKTWRDLIRDQCDWRDITVFLYIPNKDSTVQPEEERGSLKSHEFLRYFKRHWNSLKTLRIERRWRFESRASEQPVLTNEQVAQILPQASQLKKIGLKYMKVRSPHRSQKHKG